ncbi:TPA: hypothetical protein ACNR2W_004672 [Escherichia coli]
MSVKNKARDRLPGGRLKSYSGLLMKLRARTRNPVTRLSGIMVMALKKWCLILVCQVQIYQLQLDEQA